ncbi:MAG TPA: ribosome maturation factor RimM [Desulfomonilia bacterium]|nr:ribosome maturation factor RimM [Desulfomonilia bacterium]
MTDLIEIARISGPHGLKGRMRILPFGDSFERFVGYSHLMIGRLGPPIKLLGAEKRKGFYIISLEGFETISQVDPLKGETLYVKREQLEETSENEYYWRDILGLKVIDTEGALYGEVVNIFSTGSNDVYVVDKIKQYLVPATRDVIKEISLEKGSITIDASLLEGLLE